MTNKNISISLKEEHIEFITNQNRSFNLSKFVQDRLGKYIKFKKKLKNDKKKFN